MLIIFDLDDTIIDTSGSIIPFRLEQALKHMVDAGLKVANYEQALQSLKALDETAPSSKEALKKFLQSHEAPSVCLDVGCHQIYACPDFKHPVEPTQNASDALLSLHRKYKLAIVSVGIQEIQLEKMKKAGIDTSLFSSILICPDPFKKQFYLQLIEDFKIEPHRVIVVGDRIQRDLSPAKELGCKTVHMKWGRGLHQKDETQEIDFSISTLDQLRPIMTHLENL